MKERKNEYLLSVYYVTDGIDVISSGLFLTGDTVTWIVLMLSVLSATCYNTEMGRVSKRGELIC